VEVERLAGGTSLIDVLDRILDKGIVFDFWVRTSLTGIDLLSGETAVVIASTHLTYSGVAGRGVPAPRDTFGSYTSSESALPRGDDDDDEDGGGGGGSSGAPAMAYRPVTPRRRRPDSRPRGTRRDG
jgi:hypothetical protein